MVNYKVIIAGDEKFPQVINIKQSLEQTDSYTILFPSIDPKIKFNDPIQIYRDNVKIFDGTVENKILTYSEAGQDLQITAIDKSVPLAHRITGRELYPDCEPADIIRCLLQPTIEAGAFVDKFDSDYGRWPGGEIKNGVMYVRDGNILNAWPGNISHGTVEAYVTPLSYYNGSLADFYLTKCGVVNRGNVYAYLGQNDASGSKQVYLAVGSAIVASKDYDWGYNKTYKICLTVIENLAFVVVNGSPLLSGDVGSGSGWAGVCSEKAYCYFDDFQVYNTTRTASASHNSGYAKYAIDAIFNTFWNANASQRAGMWFQIDLGTVISNVTKVGVYQDSNDYARNYKIDVSADGVNWTTVGSKSGNYKPTILHFFSPRNVRYVKITITAGDSHDWKIKEIFAGVNDGAPIISNFDLDEYGSVVTMRFDYERRLTACKRVAEICNYDFWIDVDGKAYFKQKRGSDKSAEIKFESYRNCELVRRVLDARDIINKVTVLGQGEYLNQLKATAENPASQAAYGVHEAVIVEKDIIDLKALQLIANTIINECKEPTEEISLEVNDTFRTGSWGVGDYVYVSDAKTGLAGKYRVFTVTRKFSDEGEKVEVELKNFKNRLTDILKSIEVQIKRFNQVPQDTLARSFAG
jgi:hypothetical protein